MVLMALQRPCNDSETGFIQVHPFTLFAPVKFAFIPYNVGLSTTISAWSAMPEIMNLSPSPSVSWLDVSNIQQREQPFYSVSCRTSPIKLKH